MPSFTSPISRTPYYVRQPGTSPAECWYPVLTATSQSFVNVTLARDNLRAYPFFTGRGGTLDRIGIYATAVASSVARIGIYTNTSDVYNYPDALVVDSGELDCSSTGIKSATISVPVPANALYWVVIVAGTANPSLRSVPAGAVLNVLGNSSSLGVDLSTGWTVSYSYAALPSTFTGGASLYAPSTGHVAIHVRYAS